MVKAAAEKPVEEKPAERDPFAPIATGVREDGLRWHEHRVFGEVHRIREYTTGEDDDAWDLSENAPETPGGETTWNDRLRKRHLLALSHESPKVTVDDIAAWPSLKTRMLMLAMDRLNSLPPADDEGNG